MVPLAHNMTIFLQRKAPTAVKKVVYIFIPLLCLVFCYCMSFIFNARYMLRETACFCP